MYDSEKWSLGGGRGADGPGIGFGAKPLVGFTSGWFLSEFYISLPPISACESIRRLSRGSRLKTTTITRRVSSHL